METASPVIGLMRDSYCGIDYRSSEVQLTAVFRNPPMHRANHLFYW